MSGPQIGGYGPTEIEYLIEHNNLVLLELDDVALGFDGSLEPGGAGLGRLTNTYHKRTKAPKGDWSISRAKLARADNGGLFLDLLKGSAYILTEWADAAAATLTTGETIVSVLQVKEVTLGTVWREVTQYTINYATHAITFLETVPAGGVEVEYITDQIELTSPNLITNGGFEDALTSIWTYFRTGGDTTTAVAQNSANKDVGVYALGATVTTQNSGALYLPSIVVIPGRMYRFRFRIKGTSTETFKAQWTDAGATVDMTPVASAGTLSGTAYHTWEYTFTPDEGTITDIRIINTTASPHVCYLDEVYLGFNASAANPLDGQHQPFTFNIIGRRVADGVTVFKAIKCAAYNLDVKSGAPYKESIKGQFLDYEGE